ncbi:MAG TPA: E3 binding domain-containing protein, partial [Gaiellaceae bacterium]|nr:E3 binding domain-containing protein [Gaiellaceae bacterium]
MAEQVTLPRLGQGMESGTIVRWLKSEGDQVEKGEPLYELDTEKVTQEVEADSSGVLLKILVLEGEVPVGRSVAVIGEAGESVPDEQAGAETDEGADQSAEKPAVAPEREDERERGREAGVDASDQPTEISARESTAKADGRRDGGRVKASPLARRLAKERGIELSSLQGTGPEGRIVAEDVERAAAAPKSWA